jgi:hypothetical protein
MNLFPVYVIVIVAIGALAIYANWIRPPCQHPVGKLSVIAKEVPIRTTDDKLFETWLCSCKCDKCGATVQQKFAFGTDKFYDWRRKNEHRLRHTWDS